MSRSSGVSQVSAFGFSLLFAVLWQGPAVATPVTIDLPMHYRSVRSPNTVGWGVGDRLVFGALFVEPVAGTTVSASQDGVTVTLKWLGNDIFPNQFGWSVPYNPNLTGSWELIATNGSNSNLVMTPARTNAEALPFVRNATLHGTGLTPTISWDVPAGTGADATSIMFFDDVTNLRIYYDRGPAYSFTSYEVPSGLLEANHPYVVSIRLEATEGDVVNYNASQIITRSETFINFTPTTEGQPSTVLLPTVGEDPNPSDEYGAAFTFDCDVTAGESLVLDPVLAIGYEYRVGGEDTVRFASVILPEAGDNLFDLYLFDGDEFYLTLENMEAGAEYVFAAEGVALFKILGIELEAGLDSNDATAFMTELTFTGSGRFTGSMTPIISGCFGDIQPENGDGDVDGADLAVYALGEAVDVSAFANDFSKNHCWR